jgi:hypothetical protein
MKARTEKRWTVIALSCALLFSAGAYGQQRIPILVAGEGVKSRYIQQHVIDVGDVPGHQIRVQESQRTFPAENQPAIEGEKVIEAWIRGMSNYTNGIGPTWGYVIWVTDKGNKIFLEYSGTSESTATESGSRRGTYHGTARVVGGTGPFVRARGTLVDVGEFDTDPKAGYNRASSRGEYWLEQ